MQLRAVLRVDAGDSPITIDDLIADIQTVCAERDEAGLRAARGALLRQIRTAYDLDRPAGDSKVYRLESMDDISRVAMEP